MNLKIVLVLIAIIAIVSLALFGAKIKERALKEMVKDIPEYNCGKGEICTSCIIDGNECSCGKDMCKCGNINLSRSECSLYS